MRGIDASSTASRWSRRGAGAVVVAIAVIAVAGVLHASEPGERERCMADGGRWFATVGCETKARRIDRIIVDKSDRTLSAYEDGRLVKRFGVALGPSPAGQKERQGDGRTPEGVYPIIAHNPASAYHRSLRIGYPTPAQSRAARRAGVDPGGDIMIHGLPPSYAWLGRNHVRTNWTAGCIALSDDEIDWLYRYTPDGATVEVRP